MQRTLGTRPHRPVIAFVALAISLAAVALFATPAFAQNGGEVAGGDLTGCSGQARSQDADGEALGSVTAPGPVGASQDKPLLVDWDGAVTYSGSSDNVITDHSWRVTAYGIPTRTGGSENADEETKTKGTETMSEFLPFRITGLYYVAGEISGDGGECDGALWLKIQGSPIGTVPWIIGVILAGAGIALFMGPVRPSLVPASAEAESASMDAAVAPVARKKRHPVTGLLVGAMLGVGAATILVTHAIAPFGKATVFGVIAIAAAAGVATGVAGPARDKLNRGRRKKLKTGKPPEPPSERRNI